MTILYSPRFAREYKKLPIDIKEKMEVAERLFRKDPFTPQLKTHKLTGRLEGRWAFSVTSRHRVIFRFYEREVIWFLTIGDHSIYK